MKKVTVLVYHTYLQEVIDTLHETGLMEIIHIGKKEPDFVQDIELASMDPEASILTTYELRLTRLIDILKTMQKRPSGIKAFLHPQLPEVKTIEKKQVSSLYKEIDDTLETIEDTIIKLNAQVEHLKEKETSIKQTLEQIEYLTSFDIPVETLGETTFTITKVGLTTEVKKLEDAIKNNDLISLSSQQHGTGKKTQWAALLLGHSSQKDTIEKLARDFLSEFDLSDLQGTPQEIQNSLHKEQKQLESEKKDIKKKLQTYASTQLSELLCLREQTYIARAKKEVSQNFAKTTSTYVIQGWVIEDNVEQLSMKLSTVAKEYHVLEAETPSPNPDHPPTYLKTPWWARGFRDLLEMFAAPRYNELNPTIIMGFFFILFFGFMLGDAGYGGILFILSLIGFFKFGKHSEMIKNWSFMGIWMGLTSIIVGILTYSIFGNLIHLFFYNDPPAPIYSFSLMGMTFPVDSLRDPLLILTAALLLGLLQLNVGLILGMIQSWKQKKYKELLTEKFCWVPMQIGGGLLIGKFIMGWTLSELSFYLSAVLVIIGLVLLLIASGPVGFFDITGYVGDWLSYARLLALGLATAGMALAFNIVSQLLGEMIPVIGIVITVLLLFIMHIVNLALSTLGAAVHSLRLQYVEFFNRFYEGGGTLFSPFKISRKYTQLKEKE